MNDKLPGPSDLDAEVKDGAKNPAKVAASLDSGNEALIRAETKNHRDEVEKAETNYIDGILALASIVDSLTIGNERGGMEVQSQFVTSGALNSIKKHEKNPIRSISGIYQGVHFTFIRPIIYPKNSVPPRLVIDSNDENLRKEITSLLRAKDILFIESTNISLEPDPSLDELEPMPEPPNSARTTPKSRR